MPLLDALQYVGETLDKPWAAGRGLLAGRPDQLLNLVPFSDALGLTNPKERVSGRGMLESWGVLDQNTPGLDLGDVAGFGVELMDPLNLLGMGLIAKTTGRASAAKYLNKGIAADRAAVESANAASQAMRQAGALPEELLPQAKKLYRYHADFAKAPQSEVPGFYDRRLDLDYESPGEIGKIRMDEPDIYNPIEIARETYPDLAELPAGKLLQIGNELGEGIRFYPELQALGKDDIANLLSDVDEALEGVPFPRVEHGGFSVGAHPRLQSTAESVKDQIGFLGKGTPFGKPRNVNFKRLDEENLEVLAEELNQSGVGLVSMTKPTGGFMGDIKPEDVQKINQEALSNLYREILREPNHPLYSRLRATEELRDISKEADNAIHSAMHPPREFSESFYALPNPTYIDRELAEAVTSDMFPASLLESIEKGSTPITDPRVRSTIGERLHDMLLKNIDEGRTFPGPWEDVFQGGQTFLPYVAPAIRELPAFRDVPQVPKSLFAALLGHNALARGAQ